MRSEAIPHIDPAPIPFAGQWQYELHFPRDLRGPGVARIALRAILAAHSLSELADRAELLASELATNSVRHTKGPAYVRLQWLHPVLRISVWDASPDLPEPADPSADAEDGRGLLILDLVADRWGACPMGEGAGERRGKTIWCELVFA